MYSLDFRTWAAHYLPPELANNPKLLAWVRSFISPMQAVNDEFVAYLAQKQLEMSFNGQTIVLQRALNLTFNPDVDYDAAIEANDYTGCILIDNTGFRLPKIGKVYFKSENQGSLGLVYFKSEGQGSIGKVYYKSEYKDEYDFQVKIPVGLSYDEAVVTAFVNRYKLAGKRFKIVTY